jgi:hypothetical protein
MFQFTYKLKVAERVKGSANGIHGTTRSGTNAAESRVDAPLASLSL